MRILYGNIPKWLHESKFYRSLDSDENEEIEIKEFKETEEVDNMEDFEEILKAVKFWQLDTIPYTVYLFAYYNKEDVVRYIHSEFDFFLYKKYKQIRNFRETPEIQKTEILNFAKKWEFPKKIIDKISESKPEELNDFFNNFFNKNKFKSILTFEEAKDLNFSFANFLKFYGNQFYHYLMDDVKKNKTLVNEIKDVVNFYKNNKTYYMAEEFLMEYKEHKKRPKYDFLQEKNSNDDEGGQLYTTSIFLADIRIFSVFDDPFNFEKTSEKNCYSIEDYNNTNFRMFEKFTFGVYTKGSVLFFIDKGEIRVSTGNGHEFHCVIFLNIFNTLEIFEKLKNLKFYVL